MKRRFSDEQIIGMIKEYAKYAGAYFKIVRSSVMRASSRFNRLISATSLTV